jgi:hypothetical protein
MIDRLSLPSTPASTARIPLCNDGRISSGQLDAAAAK